MIGNTELARLEYSYELPKALLENPEGIQALKITLPNGLAARFIRTHEWKPILTS
jgi:hypothetical protein